MNYKLIAHITELFALGDNVPQFQSYGAVYIRQVYLDESGYKGRTLRVSAFSSHSLEYRWIPDRDRGRLCKLRIPYAITEPSLQFSRKGMGRH